MPETNILDEIPTEEKIEIKKRGRPKKEKKEIGKSKLDLQFITDTGDKNPPKIQQFKEQEKNKESMQIDYEVTARGFLQMIDMIFHFISMVSKGQIIYEKLTEPEFKAGTNALVMEKQVLEVIASQSWALHAIVMMQLVGVFAPRIKLKKKKKKEIKEEEIPIESAEKIKQKQVKVQISKEQLEKIKETVNSESGIFLDDTVNMIQKEGANLEDLDNSSGELPLINIEKHDENYGKPVEGRNTKLVLKKNDN